MGFNVFVILIWVCGRFFIGGSFLIVCVLWIIMILFFIVMVGEEVLKICVDGEDEIFISERKSVDLNI